MRRGIIRIVSGIVLLILQVLSMIGLASADASTNGNLGYYIGFYSPAIIGIALLFFGNRAYQNYSYSKVILHSNSKRMHTVVKWIGFVFSTLLFVNFLISFIDEFSEFNIYTLLSLFGMLTLSLYSLSYMYKKPSCLFSASLIFVGAAYIYGIFSNLTYYLLYLPDTDYFVPYVITGIIPRLAVGILYIVAAAILYKEDFSVKTIKIFGWLIFALEILSNVVANLIAFKSILYAILIALPDLPFAVITMLYMSVLEVNSLRNAPVSVVTDNYFTDQYRTDTIDEASVPAGGWRCSCGRVHAKYESSCVCGKSRFDNQNQPVTEKTSEQILFCRKCGTKLIEGSLFCSKCGTEVAKEKEC